MTNGKLLRAAGAGLVLSGIGILLSSSAMAQGVRNQVTPVTQGQLVDYSYEDGAAEPAPVAPGACGAASSCCETACGGYESACCGNSCDWCCLGEPYTLQKALHGDCPSPITVGGWMQFGYHNEKTGLFNKHDNRVNMHQFWLYAEKVADGTCGWDWGFRTDIMYGVDAADTQAFGNQPGNWDYLNGWDHGIYGWAMPQAYGEVAYGDLSIIAGHFFTKVGYEVVTAPDNFFYSHAFTMNNSEPFTHTGALATYKMAENVEVYGGWTAGWDSGYDAFNDGDSSDGSNFLGGASVGVTDAVTLAYITTVGDLGWRGEGYSHSIVADVTVTDSVNYVIQSDLVETNSGGDHQVGVNQYLFHTINDCLKTGARVEWWKNSGVSFYEVTGGVNYRPHANLILRPEVRYQWSDNHVFATASGIPSDEAIFGMDAIVTF